MLAGLFQTAGNSAVPGFLFSRDLADELEESRGSGGAQETNTITAVARSRLLGAGNPDPCPQHRQGGAASGHAVLTELVSPAALRVSWFLPRGSTSCPSRPCSVPVLPFSKVWLVRGQGPHGWTSSHLQLILDPIMCVQGSEVTRHKCG